VSAEEPTAGPPRRWLRHGLLTGSVLVTVLGLLISPTLGLALALVTVVLWVGVITWAFRTGLQRARTRRETGEEPDLRLLERRARTIFWWILVCFAVATAGVVLILASRDRSGPAWPLILLLVLMAAGLVGLWVFAQVVLPQRRRDAN
jgi:DMSO reductase anchor subunit